jgi:hypothetical protein
MLNPRELLFCVLTVIHNRGGDIFASNPLIPRSLNIQIQSSFAAILSSISEIPLKGKVRIGWQLSSQLFVLVFAANKRNPRLTLLNPCC